MLNSLVIKNFRMLEDFTVEKLGRVNLIVGKNNSGKSTVLEALRIYAGNGNFNLLKEIAKSHDEEFPLDNSNLKEPNISFPYKDLFPNRNPDENKEAPIIIGESVESISTLFIYRVFHQDGVCSLEKNEDFLREVSKKTGIIEQTILVERKKGGGQLIKLGSSNFTSEWIFCSCSFIPTQFVSMEELKKDWEDNIYMTNEEDISRALRVIAPNFQQLGFYGESPNLFVKVKLASEPKPVPLKSLGDGMLRILQIAIKLVSAQGGFLLIDEFENGLHYSVQEDVWKLLFEMAEKLDVQVFATTHSWDCVRSFNAVAMEKENIEAILFRMGRSALNNNKDQVIATIFDKEKLSRMTESDIEVR